MSKTKHRGRIFLFLFFVGLGGLPHAATLQGTVLDPSGKVVPGARVSLVRSLVAVAERQTDARGEYRFDGLQDGAYQVTAGAQGLASPSIDIVLSNNEDKSQDIRLELSALATQVVVTASLGGALVPHIGSSVSLANHLEMEERGAQNVLEILRGTPGIEVSQSGRRGGVTGVYIRGGESYYNAVLVDGIPMNEFGGAFDMASLPTDGLDRVEITRGPASALYGSNAVTGVINLISRRGEGPPQFSALAEGGSYSTRRFASGGNGISGGLSWSYTLSRLDSDGVVANDHYRNQSAFLSLGYQRSSRRQVEFYFFGNANNAGAPGPYGSDPAHLFPGIDTVSRSKQNLFGYQLNYREQVSTRYRQVTTISLATNDFTYFSPWGNSFFDNLRGTANTRAEVTVSSKDSLAVGFEFNREQAKNTYLYNSAYSPFLLPRTSLAVFAENRWSPSKQLYVIAGIRLDNLRTHSLPPGPSAFFGPTRPFIPATSYLKANPRLSLAYIVHEKGSGDRFGMTRLHGSFGTGIRPPKGYELAFTDNPNLKPEKSVSFDAGVEQALFSSRVVFDFTYFHNRFEDQIVTLGGSMANLSSFWSDNLANSRAQGLEVSFRVFPLQSLELGGQYTFLDSSILALDGASQAQAPFQVGQQLLRRPRHSANYNLAWRHRRLTLSTNAYIRGAVLDTEPNWGASMGFFKNKGYVRADAGASYHLYNGVEIYVRLNNFLNQRYEEVFGYPSLRLNVMGGMRFRFPME